MAPSLASRGWDFSPRLWDCIVLGASFPLGAASRGLCLPPFSSSGYPLCKQRVTGLQFSS